MEAFNKSVETVEREKKKKKHVRNTRVVVKTVDFKFNLIDIVYLHSKTRLFFIYSNRCEHSLQIYVF